MYFVTVCVADRKPLLGRVEDETVRPSRLGEIVVAEIQALESRFTNVRVDLSVVMPDHVHLIVVLGTDAQRLGIVIGSLKAPSSREINRVRGTTGSPVWQRGYYDHVIRDEADLNRIREYIATNPLRWTLRHRSP
jgi:REP element-mobilizing transposase RayT